MSFVVKRMKLVLSIFFVCIYLNPVIATECSVWPSEILTLPSCCEIPQVFTVSVKRLCHSQCSKVNDSCCAIKCLLNKSALINKEVNTTMLRTAMYRSINENTAWTKVSMKTRTSFQCNFQVIFQLSGHQRIFQCLLSGSCKKRRTTRNLWL